MKLNIYTDGAYSSSTKVGGWAMVVAPNNNSEYYHKESNYEQNTTNNRMELYAVLEALKYIYNHTRYNSAHSIDATIYTDSAYISNCFKDKWYEKWEKNGWKTSNRTPVLNQDLWKAILQYYFWVEPFTKIKKVEGHAGNKWNDLADELAVTARTIGAKNKRGLRAQLNLYEECVYNEQQKTQEECES